MALEHSKQAQVVKLPEIPIFARILGVAVCACSKSQAYDIA